MKVVKKEGMYKALKLKIGEQNLCPFPHKHDKTGKHIFREGHHLVVLTKKVPSTVSFVEEVLQMKIGSHRHI